MTVRGTVTRPARYGFPYLQGLDKWGETRYTKGMKVDRVMKKTVSNLTSGEVVNAGYTRRGVKLVDTNRFVGFKINDCFYSDLKMLKSAFGVKNLKELEFEADRLELGSVTAEFFDVDDNYFWGSYLWNGAFRVGTSADKLTLEVA